MLLSNTKNFFKKNMKLLDMRRRIQEFSWCIRSSTNDGREFKARPAVSEEVKDYLWEVKDTLIGEICTVKFQEFSNDGIKISCLSWNKKLDDMGE
jgi:hypothetical protein